MEYVGIPSIACVLIKNDQILVLKMLDSEYIDYSSMCYLNFDLARGNIRNSMGG
jgi:hypothetical protein